MDESERERMLVALGDPEFAEKMRAIYRELDEFDAGLSRASTYLLRLQKEWALYDRRKEGLDVRPCPNSGEPCVEYCTREPGGCMHGVPDPGQQKVQ